MFAHWGRYSLHGKGEWDWFWSRTPFALYAPFADRFNPEKFNADEWVDIAGAAGRRYITVTSRHHDGFSMYDTKLSNFRITNSQHGRDPLADLAEACSKRDIKLGF
jgi:alpha-L-fucosidase